MSGDVDFDIQAAWLRRFSADAESNLGALALRLKEALPDLVALQHSKGFFSKPKISGVTVDLGQNRYVLALAHGRLEASIAMVVRGITLNTRPVPPAEWFSRLAAETKAATDQAKALSQTLAGFMAS